MAQYLSDRTKKQSSRYNLKGSPAAQASYTWHTMDATAKMHDAKQQVETLKLNFERLWLMNVAFYTGEQYLTYNRRTRRLEGLPAQNRARYHANRIKPRVRAMLSAMTQNRPLFEVQPNNPTEEDENAAEIAQGVLGNRWWMEKMPQVSKRNVLWCLVCGNSFLLPYWDPNMGDPIDREFQDIAKEFGEDVELLLGDTGTEVISPFEISPNPMATCMEDAQWFIREKYMHYEAAKMRFNTNKIEPTGDISSLNIYQHRLLALIGPHGFFGGDGSPSAMRDMTCITELWEKPTRKHPMGQFSVFAGEQEMYSGELPLGEIPLVKFGCIPEPGRFWDDSIVTQLIPPQQNYNRIESLKYDNLRLTMHPKMSMPRGLGISKKAGTGMAGERIWWTPDPESSHAKPEWIAPPNIPAYVDGVVERRIQEMDEMTAHDVSMGRTPKMVRSGKAINALQQADQFKMEHMVKDHESSWQEWARLKLMFVQEYYDEQRTLRFVGEDGVGESVDFQGADLRGNTDVRVVLGSTFPVTRTEKAQNIDLLISNGGLNPQNPTEKRLILHQILDAASVQDLNKSRRKNVKLQRWETRNRLIQGEQVMPDEGHDHLIHIEELNNFIASPHFLTLEPDAQRVIREHRMLHVGLMSGVLRTDLDGQIVQAEQPPAPAVGTPEQPNPQMANPQAPPQGPPAMAV